MNYELKTWHFGIDNDKLVNLVLLGKKTATTSIYDGNVDEVGTESILIYANEKYACVTRMVKNIITEFKNVDWSIAKLEGENNSLEEWRKVHIEFFKSIDNNFSEDTKVVVEIFEVVKNLKEERLNIGKLIANNNLDIITNIETIEEINAGFNNYIFSVNNKYIIKVCGDETKESLFDVESNFYIENKNNKNIPILYKYDNTKSIVPYVYEIIEKIDGKSVYYFWYKWNENERKLFIKKLINIIKSFHVKKVTEDNWADKIKKEVILNYNLCKNLFSEYEQKIIYNSFEKYDKVLSDNYYSLIHNDLHFDNIILDKEKNIKIIDFNDSIIAPFDYDMRILFMCKEQPWKWANIEMDPYQKPEDYINIVNYIKKYYNELTNIRYLDERMLIYAILNDIRHLPKYKSGELLSNIVNNTIKLLETM